MRYSGFVGWLTAGLVIAVVSTGHAQPAAGATAQEQMQARYQIFIMEAVLEQAVQHGARMLNHELQALGPDMVLLAGSARARGFRLDGYGVFFDVEVPALRRTVAWSFRMLDQNDQGLSSALASLRRHVDSLADPTAKLSLEQALNRLELQVGPMTDPFTPSATPVATGTVTEAAAPQAANQRTAPAERGRLLDDPAQAYTNEVKNALMDAMFDYSGPIAIGPSEWLVIAARDNEDRSLAPIDPYETATAVLRVRGSDLAAFRSGQLTREEARQRVEVREF